MTPVAGPSRPCNGKTDDNSDNSNSLRFPEVSRSFSLNFLFLFFGGICFVALSLTRGKRISC